MANGNGSLFKFPDIPPGWITWTVEITKLVVALATLTGVFVTWQTSKVNSERLEQHGKILENSENKIDEAAIKVKEAKTVLEESKIKTDKKLDVIIAETKKDK